MVRTIIKALTAGLGAIALAHGLTSEVLAQSAKDPQEIVFRRAVLKTAKPGVLVLKAWPGAEPEARSWSGGLPRMPADLAWPVGAKTGRPMSFLTQIDLSELPPAARTQGLPAKGVLWFFVALNDSIDDADQVSVLYRPEPREWSERAAPPGLEPMLSYAPYTLVAPDDPLAVVAVRQALSFRPIDTYATGTDDLPELEDWDHVDEWLFAIERAAQVRALGEREAQPLLDRYHWKTLGSPDWPQAGLFAEMAARAALDALPPTTPYSAAGPQWTDEGRALRNVLATEAEARTALWKTRRFEPLTAGERQDFQAWLRGFITRASGLTPDKTSGYRAPTRFDVTYPIEKTPMFAAYHVLARGGPAVESLPAAMRRPRVWSPGAAPSDQIVGHGQSAQDGPYVNRHNVLLLQIGGDDDASWLGDGMMLHFWITPADLAARRFDRVFPTYEGD
jgi:hypothetical protein